MRCLVVLGTRPEIIKMSPVVTALRAAGHEAPILHTGQHYTHQLDRVFFEELGLPDPEHHLDVGSGPHGAQTAKMLTGIESVLTAKRPDWVLVQGDTNTVLAGTLAARKLGVPVGHVEAGLRSGDRAMPEEQNRVVADHLSDLLFAPTATAAECLRREGLPDARIRVTGNTVVDAVQQNVRRARTQSKVLERLGLQAGKYVLMTAHRQENVDDARRFAGMLEGAAEVGKRLGVPVVYPVHPRSQARMQAFGLKADGVRLAEPAGYLDFLQLQASARLVLTDSGGVQEETCILGVPCVTLRDSTERPETLDVGANALAGADPKDIVRQAERMDKAPRGWACPFGDGHAARRIVEALA